MMQWWMAMVGYKIYLGKQKNDLKTVCWFREAVFCFLSLFFFLFFYDFLPSLVVLCGFCVQYVLINIFFYPGLCSFFIS